MDQAVVGIRAADGGGDASTYVLVSSLFSVQHAPRKNQTRRSQSSKFFNSFILFYFYDYFID